VKLISKDTFMRHENGATPMAGLFLYIDPNDPVILLRIYNSIGNDTWDEHIDYISRDNGATWAHHRLAQRREPAEDGGHFSYGEAAAVYNSKLNKLVVVTNYGYEPDAEAASLDYPHRSHIKASSPDSIYDSEALLTDFGFIGGSYMSFCHAFIDSKGRAIFPWMTTMLDNPGINLKDRGFLIRAGTDNVLADYYETAVLIGDFDQGGNASWHVGSMAPFDIEDVSRGMCEPAVAELSDGRFIMICRGSNAVYEGLKWEPKPGYKWISYSEDGCETWSKLQPLGCTDSESIESSATGSCVFRSIKNGKLYWLGNLCMGGVHAIGNWPRTHLCLAELQEDAAVAIKRETISVIDKATESETDQIQLSNFRMLQDRQTGEIVILLNRFFERGGLENLAWHDTDLYMYRVQID